MLELDGYVLHGATLDALIWLGSYMQVHSSDRNLLMKIEEKTPEPTMTGCPMSIHQKKGGRATPVLGT